MAVIKQEASKKSCMQNSVNESKTLEKILNEAVKKIRSESRNKSQFKCEQYVIKLSDISITDSEREFILRTSAYSKLLILGLKYRYNVLITSTHLILTAI